MRKQTVEMETVKRTVPTSSSPELSDYSVCRTWGIAQRHLYLLHVFRRRLNYPELKQAVREQLQAFSATVVLVEDRASGTQLIQELRSEGVSCVRACEPTTEKLMRPHAQTAVIESEFVHLPKQAHWLPEYIIPADHLPQRKVRRPNRLDLASSRVFNSVSRGNPWLNVMAPQVTSRRIEEGYTPEAIAAVLQTTPDQIRSVDGSIKLVPAQTKRRGEL